MDGMEAPGTCSDSRTSSPFSVYKPRSGSASSTLIIRFFIQTSQAGLDPLHSLPGLGKFLFRLA